MGAALRAVLCAAVVIISAGAAFGTEVPTGEFPRGLSSYPASPDATVWQILLQRIQLEPFNLVATLIFLLAILHTFVAPKLMKLSHRLAREHEERNKAAVSNGQPTKHSVSFLAEALHFFGEVEAIFGIWVVPLMIAISFYKGWPVARNYLGDGLDFTEPMFVVVIMTIAASRPVLKLSEAMMGRIAALGGGTPGAWWFTVMMIGPMLGSFITEPAAMTISALLLAEKFFELKPGPKLAYATLGLLFVNISVGGTLTHFAAPPVLMVAGKWNWDMTYMLTHFGWKAVVGILTATTLYLLWFRKDFASLARNSATSSGKPSIGDCANESVPWVITLCHVLFLAWTVLNSHYPVLFMGGFLFYLAFTHATRSHQDDLALKPALLVGFFLAGLVVHGGLQAWWIGPVLRRLPELPMFFVATGLTAFNDNAAITYLATLVPDLSETLKYAVTAGAVAGGGLTVIANAPNPAGQSILSKFFPDGVSPLGLLLGALVPTALVAAAFVLFR